MIENQVAMKESWGWIGRGGWGEGQGRIIGLSLPGQSVLYQLLRKEHVSLTALGFA